MKTIKIGLVGTGYIGRCHAIAYAQAPTLFLSKANCNSNISPKLTKNLLNRKPKNLALLGQLTIGESWLPIQILM